MSSFWQAKETISKLAFGSLCWERSFVGSVNNWSFNWWPQSAQGFPETPEESAVMIYVAMPCYAIGFAM